jgi:Mg/Co/Ni transporter MgtE
MGFSDVSDYVDGKVDWMAAGLATEGTNAQRPRAGAVARTDSPTCRLDATLGPVRERVRTAGWNACVVLNAERVVLGVLRDEELGGDPSERIEQAMRPGPSTFRPFVLVEELAHYMAEHDLPSSPITTGDGRLVGLLRLEDALRASEEVQARLGAREAEIFDE